MEGTYLQQGLICLSRPNYALPWLISGNGRSGTTAAMRVSVALGLKPHWNNPTGGHAAEAGDFDAAWRRSDFDKIQQIRTSLGSGYVFKVPGLAESAARNSSLRSSLDCNYIFVIRDAAAETHYDLMQHGGGDVGEFLNTRASMTLSQVQAARALAQDYGVLVVSYEKFLLSNMNPSFMQEYCQLIGGDIANIETGLSEIRTNDPRYFKPFLER